MQKPQGTGKSLNLDAALTQMNNQMIGTESHIATGKVADTGQNLTTTGAARGVKICI